jgi:F420H(2)-dependent quinone reductase
MGDREEILRSLSSERTVDIVTIGRRSGEPRTTEIWITPIGSRMFICGTPNASRNGVVHAPRDWLANLKSHAALVVRLKTSISAELTADASPITDLDERRRILTHSSTQYYRDAVSLDAAVAHSPIVELTFTGEAAWVNDARRDPTD